ncbi:G-protein coupled receptor GRL101-like [Saccostrea echinata]|uniref:G-protein coupled receptor GRL101-like n=1 Tax=Saccostrea echinata TaxID=191078 RepID=UPI002A7EBC1A|nr:G-protein coupled receptor GRL101-like [Saccostrea echinata]
MVLAECCILSVVLMSGPSSATLQLLASSARVDCDFEKDMCGWTTGRNFSSPTGSNQFWALCPRLPTSNDLEDTCAGNVGFKFADPFSRHNLCDSKQTDNSKGFPCHDGFVLSSSNKGVEPPFNTQYSTFYTSNILSEELPGFFLYRCLHYSYSMKGQSVLIVSYLPTITEAKTDAILKEHRGHWLTGRSEEWISGNSFVDLPLIPNFRIIFRVWFKYEGDNIVNLDNIKVTEGLCNVSCPLDSFRCTSGECISPTLVCDAQQDCEDMSDEKTCDYIAVSNHSSVNSSQQADLDISSRCPFCPRENKTSCVAFCPSTCDCDGDTYLCQRSASSAYTFFAQLSEVDCDFLNITELGQGIYHLDISSSHIRSLNITDYVKVEKLTVTESTIETIHIPDQVVNYVQFTNLKTNSISFFTYFMYLHVVGSLQQFSASALLHLPYVNLERNILSNATVIYKIWSKYASSMNTSHNKAVLNNCNIYQTNTVKGVESNYLDLSNNKLKTSYVFRGTEILLIRNNLLESVVKSLDKTYIKTLKTLDMSFNRITHLHLEDFTYFFNLMYLDLQSNNISWIDDETFEELSNLCFLDLSSNLLQSIKRSFFQNLEKLQYLYLQRNLISTIEVESFYSLKSLVILDLSNNKITSLKGKYFRNLEELRYLYLQNNKFQVSEGMFDGLSSLRLMQVDFFSLCCAKPRNIYDIKCIAPENEISSCTNLIAVPILNVGIWYIALFAAFGNFAVFWYKIIYLKRQSARAHFIFTINLNWADFVMGIYLFIIAIANLVYNGRYGLEDYTWRNSYFCTIAGILATLSSETSAFLVFLITMDRLIAIKFPFSGRGFTRSGAIFLSVLSWLVSLFLGLLPIIPMQTTFFDSYYARSGICISLPLSVVKKSGWQYSMAVFIGLNFLLFTGILIGQIAIFVEVIKVGSSVTSSRSKQREISLTKSLAAIVLTDMFCWIPIGTIGLLTFFEIDVSSEVYDWIIVIVLPINSALNPIIYNFTAFMRHKRRFEASESNVLKQECALLKKKLEAMQSLNSNCTCQKRSTARQPSINIDVFPTDSTFERETQQYGLGVTVVRMDTKF